MRKRKLTASERSDCLSSLRLALIELRLAARENERDGLSEKYGWIDAFRTRALVSVAIVLAVEQRRMIDIVEKIIKEEEL